MSGGGRPFDRALALGTPFDPVRPSRGTRLTAQPGPAGSSGSERPAAAIRNAAAAAQLTWQQGQLFDWDAFFAAQRVAAANRDAAARDAALEPEMEPAAQPAMQLEPFPGPARSPTAGLPRPTFPAAAQPEMQLPGTARDLSGIAAEPDPQPGVDSQPDDSSSDEENRFFPAQGTGAAILPFDQDDAFFKICFCLRLVLHGGSGGGRIHAGVGQRGEG